MKFDNSPARGMRDLLPDAVAARSNLLSIIVENYGKFGYQSIETPAVESIERLTAGSSGSENQKLIFQILKRGLDPVIGADTPVNELVDLGLRFDLTVPLARYYANNQAKLRMPFRALQIAPVWRAERPQKGRFRQFVQCDIDIIGEPTVLAEIELITATSSTVKALGIDSATISVSDRRVLTAIAEEAKIASEQLATFFIVLDKLDKIGWDGVGKELDEKGISASSAQKTTELLTQLSDVQADGLAATLTKLLPSLDAQVATDLETTLNTVSQMGSLAAKFDPSLVRGMGYYTGQIFEMRDARFDFSIAGGGRYDELIGSYSGKSVPACGFSIGFERILELLGESTKRDGLAIVFEDEVDLSVVMSIATKYRADGYDVSVVRRSGSMKAQTQRLDEWGFASFVYVKAGTDANSALSIEKLD